MQLLKPTNFQSMNGHLNDTLIISYLGSFEFGALYRCFLCELNPKKANQPKFNHYSK